MSNYGSFIAKIFGLCLLLCPLACGAESKALLLDINGFIGPAMVDYVQRGLNYGKTSHASIIILKLNTPGGLDSSMHHILNNLTTSPIPVIAYIAPEGMRTANTSTFNHLASEKIKIINANNEQELMQKINGQSVPVLGTNQLLKSEQRTIEKMPPDWRFRFIEFITNPNVAYLLLLLALYGLFFELTNPGLILPGVAGIIALLLVLYAFQLMPIDYIGLSLVLVGIFFFILEISVPSFGILGIGGIIAFIIGSIMLFNTHDPSYDIAFPLILSMSILSAGFFFVVISLALRSQKRKVISGREGIIGAPGVVLNIDDKHLNVQVLGEIWAATSSHELHKGQEIKVIEINGLSLKVVPFKHDS